MQIQRDPDIDLLPYTVERTTLLAADPGVAIIHPGGDPVYSSLAGRLAAAIEAQCGFRPECVADDSIMPERSTSCCPPLAGGSPCILLGSLNTNRALLPLYADYLCSTDATYPGGDGYDLRTIVNPHGAGRNAVLAGGSSARGVGRAVGRLIEIVAELKAPFALPFLLEVELHPALAADLAAWPQTPLEDTSELQANRARG